LIFWRAISSSWEGAMGAEAVGASVAVDTTATGGLCVAMTAMVGLIIWAAGAAAVGVEAAVARKLQLSSINTETIIKVRFRVFISFFQAISAKNRLDSGAT